MDSASFSFYMITLFFIQEAGNRSFPYVYHSRLFPGTALCGIGTAGTEYAAARGIQRTRQGAPPYNALGTGGNTGIGNRYR